MGESSNYRTYLNRKGETVSVSKSHLDVAVKLKIELQKMSPSLRCDWKKHKAMMEVEGYDASDTNESYRCLVKDYQREIGLLNPLCKHVDMVAESKLASLDRLLGELYSEKREAQLALSEINKFRKDFHLSKEIANEIISEFKNFKIPKPVNFVQTDEFIVSRGKAIVVLTDLHIGVVIDNVYGNYYNYEIAKKRMRAYLSKVIDNCKRFQITDVKVIGLGDFVEHVNMRYKQSANAEFNLAKQILKASELVIEFLVSLSQHVKVDYSGIAGNHDRLQGDKNIAFDDDNANVIINSNVEKYIEFYKSKNLTYTPTADGATEINVELNGKKIKLVHGHMDEGNKRDRMKGYISMQNEFFDCLVYGHLHNYNVQESDHGRMTVGVGCLSGRNDYSKTFQCATNASQMMMVITDDGDLIPMKIDLQNAA
jgi:predicted phosphodiesterase